MEVPTIYKPYVREYPQKIWPKNGTNVAPFQDPEIPIEYICFRNLHIDMYNYLDATRLKTRGTSKEIICIHHNILFMFLVVSSVCKRQTERRET